MNKDIAIEEALILAEQGDMEAQFNLGVLYEEGIEVPDNGKLRVVKQDYRKAFEWFTKSAEQGHADAQNNLGLMYKEGSAIPQNDYEAFKWWAKSAEQGNADAQNNLGLIYRDGKETPTVVYMKLYDYEINGTTPSVQDYEELFREFELDSPESFDDLDVAKALSKIQGIDPDKAVDWFIKAVASGSDAAQINLKNMFGS